MSSETMTNYLGDGLLKRDESKSNDFKKELTFDLLKRDFELIEKQNDLASVFEDASFYKNCDDELLAINFACSIAFDKDVTLIDNEIKSMIEEVCVTGLFDVIYEKINHTISGVEQYATIVNDFIWDVAKGQTRTARDNKVKSFFSKFHNSALSCITTDFFKRNYSQYLDVAI
jgi:hypothetical protein